MTPDSRQPHVILSACVIVGLGGLLAVRLLARDTGIPSNAAALPSEAHLAAPRAGVPAPALIDVASLRVPCWGCPGADAWPIRFRTDLDLLAPLGDGPGNAAEWFRDFAKPNGARLAEAEAAMARRVEHGDVGGVLAPDDPLLLEAEPWVDQAAMRFYPDVFPVQGYYTQLPNLLLALTFARSWLTRGMDSPDPAAAMTDFRRAIRLGRLLRQDDVTIIADLVGLACIRLGAEGIYDAATKEGDTRLALVAAIVLGEHAPQRLLTRQRLSSSALESYGHIDEQGRVTLALPDTNLDAIVDQSRIAPDRRFRAEAIASLHVVRACGTPRQREQVEAVLRELAASDDAVIAAMARWNGPIAPDDLKGFFKAVK